jgi:hydrogenase/urease accessory protein HupE
MHKFFPWFFLLLALPLNAHEARPFHIELTQQSEHRYLLRSKTPPSLPVQNTPLLLMPEQCRHIAGQATHQQLFECNQPLDGQWLTIQYPVINPSISSLIRFNRLSGEVQNALLSPQQLRWQIPAQESLQSVAVEYTELGVIHILVGYDHLLFLCCLVFLAGTAQRVFLAVTGFTAAHSLTLALAALGIVKIPVPFVEAVIALSIVFLARELVGHRRDTLSWRYPVLVACGFGLLHGLGFAAVLTDIGLPQTQLIPALLFFNLGVEIGQLLFIVVIALLHQTACWLGNLTTNYRHIIPAMFKATVIYFAGGLSALWAIERIESFI